MKLLITLMLLLSFQSFAYTDDQVPFSDTQLEESLVYPDWFELSSGDLSDDVKDAVEQGKSGIIVYFGQKRCSYCEQFLEVNLAAPDISYYIQKHYAIIPVDIWGVDDIIDTDGTNYSEHDLAMRYKTNFTPSLVFSMPRENLYSDYEATTLLINFARPYNT